MVTFTPTVIHSTRLEISRRQFNQIKWWLNAESNRIAVVFEMVHTEWKPDQYSQLLYFIERVANGFTWKDDESDKLIAL